MGERLTVGVAARLSRYLQVLTQAKKMGKERISSQEISEYTNINATQIRRDLSGFGKFGKRGVGLLDRRAARRDPQDPAHAGSAQHRALRRRAVSARRSPSSTVFADHGFNIAAVFDTDRRRSASRSARRVVSTTRSLRDHGARARTSSSACSRCRPRPRRASRTISSTPASRIIFNYSEALLSVPPDVTVHTTNPAAELLYALYFYLT